MINAKVFNRGIASGEAFCNRTEESARLTKNIKDVTHTLLISPRRYGKTSLALRVIEGSKLPYTHIDLFMKYDEASITNEFYMGMSSLISQVIKPTAGAIKKLESLLKNLSVSMSVGKFGFEFTLKPRTIEIRKNLKALLMNVDELLVKNKKHAIIFIDEIQAITDSPMSDEVESSLRFVAQKTKNISFIFSGSNRHLLSKMFDDLSRPLYKLCQRMQLQRISADHYKIFINKFAKSNWKISLSDEVLDDICHYTKLHPYYMNILCNYLFELDKPPTPQNVKDYWEKICREEQGSVAKDIEFLTPKQKYLLNEIARHPCLKEPTGQEFVNKVNLTPKGILGAIDTLMRHDLIERLETGEIRLIDPVLEYWSK